MIIYLHGSDSNSLGNHEKVLQLQFIDPDVRNLRCRACAGYWAERIGFLSLRHLSGDLRDEALDSQRSPQPLHPFYEIVWDDIESHKFCDISPHLQRINAFKTYGKHSCPAQR